jgi:hypothetical protein
MNRRGFLTGSAVILMTACGAATSVPSQSTPPMATAMPTATVQPTLRAEPTLTARPTSPPEPTATTAASTVAGDLLYVRDDYGTRGPGQIAVIDTASGRSLRQLPLGLANADWSALFSTDWSAVNTVIRRVLPSSGETRATLTVGDRYNLAGLSPRGRRLALQRQPTADEERKFTTADRWQSDFLIVEATLTGTPKRVSLNGNFEFDTIGDSDSALFVVENLPPNDPTHYQVRLYDLSTGTLQPGAIADKTSSEVMSGYRHSSVFAPDGTWLYSLYVNLTKGPFIHALNLEQRFAVCIDLPEEGKQDFEKQLLWSMAMTPSGQTLYAANSAVGQVAAVDLGHYVLRTGTMPVASTGSPGLVARLANRLVPAAEAKRLLVGGAALSPDGQTLFAIGDKGLVAIRTNDLGSRGHYLQDWPLDSIALNADGTRLYAVSGERGAVLALDPQTGKILATVHGADHPAGLLRIETTA